MNEPARGPRYRVSNLGFGFAVHDTESPQEYAHPAGRDKQHRSRNRLNSRILEIVPTRAQAQRIADQLNRKSGG
jgi:hypothetical protein